jgi:hypothetical protein
MTLNLLLPHTLTWSDVDPKLHPFDPSSAYTIALSRLPEKKPMSDREVSQIEDDWEDSITSGLVEQYGRWATGWRWASDEGSIGGGPVKEWCCPRHSWTSSIETAKRVQSALVDWRNWIEQLSGRFAELAPNAEVNLTDAFKRAVVVLVTDVVKRTAAGDAWYLHCEQVLGWYLELYGLSDERAANLIRNAIGGRFESWIAPEDNTLNDVAEKVATSAASLLDKQYE